MIPPQFLRSVRVLDVGEKVRLMVSGVEIDVPACEAYTEDGAPITTATDTLIIEGMWWYRFATSQGVRQVRATLWAVYDDSYLLSVDGTEGRVEKDKANTPSGAPLVAGEQDLLLDVGAWLWATTD